MEIDQIIPALRNGFGSDNHAGIHPEILQAVIAANVGHAHSYGDDPFTERAEALIRRHFGNEAVSYFVFNVRELTLRLLQQLLRHMTLLYAQKPRI